MPLAYFDYHPDSIAKLPFIGTGIDMLAGVTPFYNPGVVEGTHVLGGRVPYPFYHPVNSNITFDGPDLDGFGVLLRNPIGEDIEMFATAAGAWITEDNDGPDTSLWGGQVGFTYLVPGMDDTYATMAVGYFDFGNIENDVAVGGTNSTDADGKYANDFDLLVANGEIKFPFCEGVPVLCDYPVTLFGEFGNNMAAASGVDNAYVLGISLGEITNIGMWQLVYNYRDVEKDAALDAVNAGFGDATDIKGHTFEVAYRLAENVSFSTAYVTGDQNVSTNSTNYEELSFSVGFAF
jgi:hypothetical protein